MFHAWLALTNGTTYEAIKGPDELWYLKGLKECDIPFSKGLLQNLTRFCCIADAAWETLGRVWKPSEWKLPEYVQVFVARFIYLFILLGVLKGNLVT